MSRLPTNPTKSHRFESERRRPQPVDAEQFLQDVGTMSQADLLKKYGAVVEEAFAEAAQQPEPALGPGRRFHECTEFPLNPDPALLRMTMMEQLRLWYPSIAGMLSRSPSSRCIVSRERVYFGSDLLALAWCYACDFIYSLPRRFTDKPSAKVTNLVGKITSPISRRLLRGRHLFTILVRD